MRASRCRSRAAGNSWTAEAWDCHTAPP